MPMTTSDYSKHKDRDPRQTVEAIRAKLASMGLETELTWTSHQFDGTWSNRVSIAGTSVGTNGKGTSEDYALASGYAELMERMQNKALGHRTHVEASFATHGFYDFPDDFSQTLQSFPDLSTEQQEAFLRAEGEDGVPIVKKHDRPFRGFHMRLPYL